MADEFERSGYARDVVIRVRDLAGDIRRSGCGASGLCPGCAGNIPAAGPGG